MKKNEIVLLVITPFLGFLTFFIPIFISGSYEITSNRITTMISSIYENVIILPTAAMLLLIGFFLGYYGYRFWWLFGLLTVIVFPINSIIEMNLMPSSHNLWPIEFAIYPIMALPAIIGSYIGKNKAR
jgi:nucleoside recognition membrane protein YjiH